MSSQQFGFRKDRSTTDFLLLLAESRQDALNSAQPSLVIALDIAAKLEHLEISGDILELLSCYLSGRSQRVVMNECTSAIYPVEASLSRRRMQTTAPCPADTVKKRHPAWLKPPTVISITSLSNQVCC